jgi:gamma-glutamylcyclotransferase (GGCT)/AIG2-like uncharacterized protein YtfP
MPLYFAYGSNMDAGAMRSRCPKSTLLGPAKLARHRLIIMAEGYASVVRDPNSNVHGVLWDLALGDVSALDRYEGVSSGLYAKVPQPVIRKGSSAVRALVYVGRSSGEGKPKPGYLENVIAAAIAQGLPDAYVLGLKQLAGQGAATLRFRAPGLNR